MRVLLRAGFRCLEPDRNRQPRGVDDQDDKVVGGPVDDLGDAPELMTQRAVNEALLLQCDSARGHPVLPGRAGVAPGGGLRDVEELRHPPISSADHAS
jgi:hypothetical protein